MIDTSLFPVAYHASRAELLGDPEYVFVARGAGSRRTSLRIQLPDGGEWVASFAAPDPGMRAISAVLSTPDPEMICVLERGVAFYGNVGDPPSIRELRAHGPIVSYRAYPDVGILALVTPRTVMVIASQSVWETPRIAVESLVLHEISGDLLHGESDPDVESRPFEINIHTAAVNGGIGHLWEN